MNWLEAIRVLVSWKNSRRDSRSLEHPKGVHCQFGSYGHECEVKSKWNKNVVEKKNTVVHRLIGEGPKTRNRQKVTMSVPSPQVRCRTIFGGQVKKVGGGPSAQNRPNLSWFTHHQLTPLPPINPCKTVKSKWNKNAFELKIKRDWHETNTNSLFCMYYAKKATFCIHVPDRFFILNELFVNFSGRVPRVRACNTSGT